MFNREIATKEGPKALFKGLGPTLVGVIPARSINFYSYGNGKRVLAERFNNGKETAVVHLSAAAIAGLITATATNPIWVVKTRMQLENQTAMKRLDKARKAAVGARAGSQAAPRSAVGFAATQGRSLSTFFKPQPSPPRPSTNSFQMTLQIVRNEGVQGLYKGMSASYLGVAEGTIQWALYEQLKAWETQSMQEKKNSLSGTISSAGIAKLVASLITYPHEVVRTRLRQEPEPGQARKYTGLLQTVKVVIREEGVAALYGGLSAHLLRVVPVSYIPSSSLALGEVMLIHIFHRTPRSCLASMNYSSALPHGRKHEILSLLHMVALLAKDEFAGLDKRARRRCRRASHRVSIPEHGIQRSFVSSLSGPFRLEMPACFPQCFPVDEACQLLLKLIRPLF
jgi:Mitochondrial carrier protein